MEYTTPGFIERARKIHGDKYDYSQVVYKNSGTKVKLVCKIHGEFEQVANKHMCGQGCRSCGYKKNSNTKCIPFEEFEKRSREKHGDKFQYDKESYTRISAKVKIICPNHGEFVIEARSHYEKGEGCKQCNTELQIKNNTSTTEEFIERSIKIHGDRYDYSKVNYVKVHIPVEIICKVHGEFLQKPMCHLCAQGCRKCGIKRNTDRQRKTVTQFIEEAKRVHGDMYDYSHVDYQASNKPVIITCKIHGDFQRKPTDHLGKDKSGCQKCRPIYHSKISIDWLNYMKFRDQADIQHIGNTQNDGEHRILNSTYHADGYSKETNTIYEFQGSYWHGDPKKYSLDKMNKHMNKSFRELYERTLKKMNHCREQGYTVIECWESDWRKACKAVILLQRRFRKNMAN